MDNEARQRAEDELLAEVNRRQALAVTWQQLRGERDRIGEILERTRGAAGVGVDDSPAAEALEKAERRAQALEVQLEGFKSSAAGVATVALFVAPLVYFAGKAAGLAERPRIRDRILAWLFEGM